MNKLVSSSFVCFLMCAVLSAQSGWTRTEKSLFAKLDWSQLSANQYFNPAGEQLETATFTQTSFNLYAEYGLNKRFTLIANAPLLRGNAFNTTKTAWGPGDLKLELKYRLLKNNDWPVAVSIAPEIPTGRRNALVANKTIPQEKINLPTGDGEFNVWTTLAASKSFGKLYGSVFGAYNFRTKFEGKEFQDLYQFGGEIGWNPWKTLWVNAKSRAQFAVAESKHPELGFVRGDATTYTLTSLEAFYKFSKNWGFSATFLTGGSAVAPLKNIYAAPYFSLGGVYELH